MVSVAILSDKIFDFCLFRFANRNPKTKSSNLRNVMVFEREKSKTDTVVKFVDLCTIVQQ